MPLIDRDEAIAILQKLADARKCNCSQQKAIERASFEYCITILKMIKPHEGN